MGTTTETRITSTQAKDAIYKAHSISSSGSEIDDSVINNNMVSIDNVIDVNGIAKRLESNKQKLFVELPSPSLLPNEFVFKVGNIPSLCYSDGSKWFDVSKQIELTEWWLPNGCEVYIDFINSRFYFNGSVKTISDLTLELNGGYSINYTLNTDAITIVTDTYKPKGLTPSGVILSLSGGQVGDRIELSPYDTYLGRYYIGGITTPGTYTYPSYPSKLGESGIFKYDGNRRVISTFATGKNPRDLVNNGSMKTHTPIIQNQLNVVRIGFGCGVHVATGAAAVTPLINSTLKKTMIFKREFTENEMKILGQGGVFTPLHFVGDSFLNNYEAVSALSLKLKDKPYYIGISQDNEGGKSLTEHAIRYANNDSKWHESVLIICEFGRDGTDKEFVLALKDMLSRIKTEKWLVLEPATITPTTQEAWDIYNKELIESCGDRYVRTLQPSWLKSNGTSEDIAEVNKGLWPLSLKTAVDNFHPSALGYDFIGEVIYKKLLELNWIN